MTRTACFLVFVLASALGLALAPARSDPAKPGAGQAEGGKPWQADVAYDVHPLDKLDIYRPANADTLAAVMFVHGGGWVDGDKRFVPREDVAYFTSRNIALVSINYRGVASAQADGLYPPVLGPLEDTQRALQFLRLHAKEFALDPDRIVLLGESAGAFNVLWLGLAPDRAQPRSSDPAQRLSTRVKAIGTIDAQTSIDPQQMRAWVGPHLDYGSQAFGLAAFDEFLARRGEYQQYFPSLSPAALVNEASPPTFLYYTRDSTSPIDPMYYIHSPAFGTGFLKIAEERHADVTLRMGTHPSPNGHDELLAFLAKALQ